MPTKANGTSGGIVAMASIASSSIGILWCRMDATTYYEI
jgi:hypothetical protein